MAYNEYFTPTYVYFGNDTEFKAGQVLKENKATKVLIHYGSNSAVKSGLLARVEKSLQDSGIKYVSLGGVQPNPRLSLCRKGIELARKEKVDFILAVGGGSVLDSAKCISYGILYDGDVWDFYSGKANVTQRVPVGTIMTLSATGSEMSNSSVITNDEKTPNDKFGSNTNFGRPVFALMNPCLTFSVSKYQTGSGSTDIIMHTLERYFHDGPDFDLTDKIAASLIRTVIDATHTALENPNDYDARANIMWAGSISHNDLTEIGFSSHGDWSCHRMEHELSALYDVAHGAGLSAIWSSWARNVVSVNPKRFAKLGKDVFGIEDKDVVKAAEKTICAFEDAFRSFNMPVNLKELGLNLSDEDIKVLAKKTSQNGKVVLGDFKKLKEEDMYDIFRSANN